MVKNLWFLIHIVVILSLAACSVPQPVENTQIPVVEKSESVVIQPEPEDVIYLNLIWHQHQPLYYPDDEGVITRPWVRVHGTKDYYDMAAMLRQYPKIHATFNLTPVLLRQIDAYVKDGAKDKYWVMSEKPADQLTEDEKEFILTRFFDANTDHIIRVHPGYWKLYEKRGGASSEEIRAAVQSFSTQDFLDLQIWFNLAWFDPEFLGQQPLLGLVEKDHDFLESDKAILFSEVSKVMGMILPIHKELQDKGQIEVITSPLAHPILPLIYDTNLALAGRPDAKLPKRYQYVQDDIAQLQAGVQMYTDHFGQPPEGLWPSEGAVAPEIVPLVSNAGYKWMASGEQVLANSLGIGAFERNAEDTVLQADQLYRPYWVESPAEGPIPGGKVLMVFRDNLISDKLGFTYSGTPGEEAAADFIRRIENIKEELKAEKAEGPHLISVILDGENAWENYDNDGKEFLNSLYQKLSEHPGIRTVTVSEYLELFPEQRTLPELFRGAWFSANYDTWIGEPEENAAWNLLRTVRADLQQEVLNQQKTGIPVPGLEESLLNMYLAEGSDWFWWYGADQDSGNDAYFDEGFRALLANVYTSLGKPVPMAVQVPIIPAQMVKPEREIYGLMETEGKATEEDWQKAAAYSFNPSTSEQLALNSAVLGVDTQNLRLLFKLNSDQALSVKSIQIYLQNPHEENGLGFSRVEDGQTPDLLGFSATQLFEVDTATGKIDFYRPEKDQWQPEPDKLDGQIIESAIELKIPVERLGKAETGDEIKFRIITDLGEVTTQVFPQEGPGRVILPDFSNLSSLMDITDPQGDDHGPGTYRKPTDPVFTPGVFDLTRFQVRYDDQIVAFDFTIAGELTNPWNGPAGYSLQTLDVYIDTDPGFNTGSQLLLPGRNLSIQEGKGWDVALWAESWTPQIFTADEKGGAPKPVTGTEMKVILDPAKSTISLRVNRALFGDSDPTNWAMAAMVLSQEGYPADGVWRVRDVTTQEAQWRFGGAPADSNHTRVIDLVWPEGDILSQEEILSSYESKGEGIDYQSVDDFAQIPMLIPLR